MKSLGTAELLDVWERGLNQPILYRALILLTAACPEMDPDDIAELHIGERDARLLQLREWMFGPRLINTTDCPQCAEHVEWDSDIADLYVQSSPTSIPEEDFNLQSGKYHLRFRLPNSSDIAAVLNEGKDGSKPSDLLKRCIITVERAGKVYDKNRLPKRALEHLGRRIEKLDPQAEIRIVLTCPVCSHQWEILFDIASFLWTEINSWAERTLHTVHTLAGAYGWSEQEILDLGPIRRQLYLGMVNR
jgi:hypothetical protein